MNLKLFQHVDMEYSPSLLVIAHVNHVSDPTHTLSDLIWSLQLGQQLTGRIWRQDMYWVPYSECTNMKLFVIPILLSM